MSDAPARTRPAAVWAFSALSAASVACAWAVNAFQDDPNSYAFLIPLSYLSLGILVKYGDQAFDAGAFDRDRSVVLALPGGLWLGSLMILDSASATLFTGLLLALLLAKKFDNRAFQLGFAVSMAMAAVALMMSWTSVEPIGLVAVLALGYLDEVVDGLPVVESKSSLAARALRQRPFLKVGIFLLCLVGVFPSFMYFFAFMSFDFGYSAVEAMSRGRCALGRA